MWKNIDNNLIANSKKYGFKDDFHINLVRGVS